MSAEQINITKKIIGQSDATNVKSQLEAERTGREGLEYFTVSYTESAQNSRTKNG